ncbi:MAG: hypothetical protein ACK4M4_08775, partial [Flavobacterium sp.]
MNLNIFNTKPLFDAATDLFEQLGVRLNSNTTQNFSIKEILKDYYKDNDAFNAVDKTFFLGIIDDSIFNSTPPSYSVEQAIEESSKVYDALILFGLDLTQ